MDFMSETTPPAPAPAPTGGKTPKHHGLLDKHQLAESASQPKSDWRQGWRLHHQEQAILLRQLRGVPAKAADHPKPHGPDTQRTQRHLHRKQRDPSEST